MSRLSQPTPEELSAEQRAVYDAIVGGKRSSGPRLFELTAADGSLHGPFNAMLMSPELGGALQRVGEVLRYESTLPASVRELVILMVSCDWKCEFEWYAHSAVARHIGMPERTLDRLRAGERPDDLTDEESVAYDVCTALSRDRALDDDLYLRAREVYDERAVTELVFLFGYYTTLAAALNAFAVSPPPGAAPVFG